jgi:hypothetical protein
MVELMVELMVAGVTVAILVRIPATMAVAGTVENAVTAEIQASPRSAGKAITAFAIDSSAG